MGLKTKITRLLPRTAGDATLRFSLVYLILSAAAVFTAYLWVPDNSSNASAQHPAIARLPPLSEIKFLLLSESAPHDDALVTLLKGQHKHVEALALAPQTSLEFKEDSLWAVTLTGLRTAFLLPELLLDIDRQDVRTKRWEEQTGKPYLYSEGRVRYVSKTSGEEKSARMSDLALGLEETRINRTTFWLGTDLLGRDVLSRLAVGGRVSLGVGLIGTGVSLLLGLAVGLIAGYWGGLLDRLLTFVMTLTWSLPAVLLTVALSFALGKGFSSVALAVGLALWVDLARVVRGQVQSLREREFIAGGRVLGFGAGRLLLRHLAPQLGRTLLILSCANFSTAILLEAGLSFLGLGVEPPTPSWGGMIQEGYSQLVVPGSRWLAIAPGVVLILQLFCLNQLLLRLKSI